MSSLLRFLACTLFTRRHRNTCVTAKDTWSIFSLQLSSKAANRKVLKVAALFEGFLHSNKIIVENYLEILLASVLVASRKYFI